MITIKRNCSSSIRDDPVQRKITLGSFTIKIEDADYLAFDWLKRDMSLTPADLLQELILAGLDALMEKYADPVEQ